MTGDLIRRRQPSAFRPHDIRITSIRKISPVVWCCDGKKLADVDENSTSLSSLLTTLLPHTAGAALPVLAFSLLTSYLQIEKSQAIQARKPAQACPGCPKRVTRSKFQWLEMGCVNRTNITGQG
ncbi:hypothetical protein BC827DRAFT_886587 [Russula dissimulans]|nr:hypothetical protein BC827DRAFT_886587 [Russula dissimulans]